jgi:hypothetical protein
MPLRLDNARALPTCPQQEQQKNKLFESRFKIDDAASPMPEPDSQNASRPGRHQIGMVGEIISESWARSNRYTRARSSESAGSMSKDVAGNEGRISPCQDYAGYYRPTSCGSLGRNQTGMGGKLVAAAGREPATRPVWLCISEVGAIHDSRSIFITFEVRNILCSPTAPWEPQAQKHHAPEAVS